MARRVLLVGAGPTGVAVLDALATRVREDPDRAGDLEVVVADPATPGPGTAFATRVATHLVNVPATRMSVRGAAPDDFDRWRREHPERWSPSLEEPARGLDTFPPRGVFGAYVADRARELLAGAGVRREPSAVTAVRPTRTGWVASPEAGRGTEGPFDEVVLCLGHLPPDPAALGAAAADPGLVTGDPALVARERPTATVGVVGTRLSGIDAALGLRAHGHRGRIVLASRRGLLPSVRGPEVPVELRAVPALLAGAPAGATSLERVARAVGADLARAQGVAVDWSAHLRPPPSTVAALRAEVDLVESGGARPWQSVLTALIPHVAGLWQLLDDASRRRFLDDHLSLWATRIAAFPVVTARRLLADLESGATVIHPGLRAIEPRAGRARLVGNEEVEVEALVNATGPGFGPVSVRTSPLLRRLLDDGLATVHPHGGLRVEPATFRALDPHGRPVPGLRVIGDLTRGTFLATNAVGNTTRQAVELAAGLLGPCGTRTTATPASAPRPRVRPHRPVGVEPRGRSRI